MHTQRQFGVMVLGLAALALLLTDGARAGAAPITWGPATTITGDSDVDTNGTLVAAFNLGNAGVANTPPVNGVTFVGLAIPDFGTAPVTSGNFTLALLPSPPPPATPNFFISYTGDTSPSAPFASLSSSYQALLSSYAGGFPQSETVTSSFSLTMNGLTAGHTYEFEWWSNLTVQSTPSSTTATAGNGVTLISNTGDYAIGGGVGQFAIGTFTADPTGSEVITFTGLGPTNGTVLDGFELRDRSSAATGAPEPSSLALLTLGGVALAGWRRWRKRRATA